MNDLFYVFVPVIIGICAMVLHMQFLHCTDRRRRAWSLAGIAVLWLLAIPVAACYCCSFAHTVEDCFRLWTIAYVLCCLCAAIQLGVLFLGGNKRNVSDLDRMKLRDI